MLLFLQSAVTALPVPATQGLPVVATDSLSVISASAVSVYVIQLLKKWDWFRLLTPNTKVLNILASLDQLLWRQQGFISHTTP